MSKRVDYLKLKMYRKHFNEKVELINKYLSKEEFTINGHDEKIQIDPTVNLDELNIYLGQLEAVIKEIKKLKGYAQF